MSGQLRFYHVIIMLLLVTLCILYLDQHTTPVIDEATERQKQLLKEMQQMLRLNAVRSIKSHDSTFSNKITFPNGLTYHGDYNGHTLNGKGILKYSKDFDKRILYRGEFKNNLFHGKGCLMFPWPNNDIFYGIFSDGDYVRGLYYFYGLDYAIEFEKNDDELLLIHIGTDTFTKETVDDFCSQHWFKKLCIPDLYAPIKNLNDLYKNVFSEHSDSHPSIAIRRKQKAFKTPNHDNEFR